ncbi:MAG: M56 family metallopeptidase, partial [Thermoanaerobaculia bacterium]
MIAALMFYGIFVSTLVALGAVAAEWLARRAEIPVRWVWTAAMLAMLGFIGVAPFRGSTPVTTTLNLPGAQPLEIASTSAGGFSVASVARQVAGIEREILLDPMRRSVGFVQSRLPESAGNYLIALWLIGTLVLVTLMIAVYLRFKRERRTWPVATLCGVDVRIAPDAGPAVIGVVRPDIVVPRWLLARTDDEQKLVIAHETEHMRALDPM